MEQLLVHERREVLIAVDPAEGSDVAFEWALRNYCKKEDHVRLIHVIKPMSEVAKKLPDDMRLALQQQGTMVAHNVVNKFMKLCAKMDIDCDWKIAEGDPREEICKEVLRICADVLIIGTRGLSAMKKALLGSVSEYCAHHSACPVIIVKPRHMVDGS